MMAMYAIAAAALIVALSGCSAFDYVAMDSPVRKVSVAPITPAPGS